jgi:hypothetical protein
MSSLSSAPQIKDEAGWAPVRAITRGPKFHWFGYYDKLQGDGHCTYLPGNQWILCDSYPDKERRQHLYLFHVSERRLVSLGRFLSPPQYTGEWRCDMHPKPSADGRSAIIDSPHGGNGRQMYLVDLSGLAGA